MNPTDTTDTTETNRRGFLRGIGALAATGGVAALAGCTSETTPSTSSPNDSTYTGTDTETETPTETGERALAPAAVGEYQAMLTEDGLAVAENRTYLRENGNLQTMIHIQGKTSDEVQLDVAKATRHYATWVYQHPEVEHDVLALFILNSPPGGETGVDAVWGAYLVDRSVAADLAHGRISSQEYSQHVVDNFHTGDEVRSNN